MAIEIVPRPKEKRGRISLSGVLFYLSILLFFLGIFGFLTIKYYQKKTNKEIEETKRVLIEKESEEIKNLEKEILKNKEKIDIFNNLFNSYRKTSGLLRFIKEYCHKKVYLTELELSPFENQAEISGKAETFEALGGQMLLFWNSEFVEEAKLMDVLIDPEKGEIQFDIKLTLDEKIFSR